MAPGNTPKPENEDRLIHAMLAIDDTADQAAKLEGLAEDGKVAMALEGARFGTLVDRYCIHWMLNCEKKS
jgi:uncharacterized glyoxalase superfamily protein PhnB